MDELKQGAEDAGVTFFIVEKEENESSTICSTSAKEKREHQQIRSIASERNRQDVYTIVDDMPRFPGCEHETDAEKRKKCAEKLMLQYIYMNIKYPAEAREAGVEGMTVVSFVVEADGQITDAKIVRSIGYGTDEEVLWIINNMPNWTPGRQDDEAVAVKYNLPVRFKLEK